MNASWTAYLPAVLREWIDGRLQLQRAIGNTGWLVFERGIRMVIGLTIGAWVARHLGPERFGQLAYVLSFVAFFQMTADLQAEAFIVRDLSQEQIPSGVVLGTAIRLRLITAFGSWLAAVGGMALFHPDEPQLILLTAIVGATLVFQAADIVDCWFESQSQSKRTVKSKMMAYAVSNGLKVGLLFMKAPLVAFAAVTAVEAAVFAGALVIAYRRFPTTDRWRASLPEAKRLWGLSWPFLLSGLMITAYMRIDQIMLKEMLGEKELGIYAAALPLAQAWTVIPTTLVTSLAPYVSRRKSRGEGEYREALVIVFRFFVLVSLCSAAATALVASRAVEFLYGAAYQQAAQVLTILVFVNIFVFQGMAQSMWVINDNLRGVNITSTAIAATVSVVSNAVLIRHFGMVGAALSYLVAQATSVVIMPCLLRKDLRTLYRRALFGGQTQVEQQRGSDGAH